MERKSVFSFMPTTSKNVEARNRFPDFYVTFERSTTEILGSVDIYCMSTTSNFIVSVLGHLKVSLKAQVQLSACDVFRLVGVRTNLHLNMLKSKNLVFMVDETNLLILE